jgi:hypothetical protein
MPTKGASDRWEACRFVVSSLRENKPKLVQLLTPLLQANLPEGRTAPDVGEQIDAVADTLELRGERMIASDQAYLDETGDDVKFREHRDEAAEQLVAKYLAQRDVYTGSFGVALAREAGFDPVIDQKPDRFFLQVQRVKQNLESPSFTLPAVRVGGVTIDPLAFAQGFDPEYTRMDDAQKDLLRERREADTKLIAKREAMELYDQWFRYAAGYAETSMRLVGMNEEADRVRPSERRPGRRAEQAEADRRETEPPPGDAGTGENGEPDAPSEEPPASEEEPPPAGGD